MRASFLLALLALVALPLAACGSTKTVQEREADALREAARAPLQTQLEQLDARIDIAVADVRHAMDDGIIDAEEAADVAALKALLAEAGATQVQIDGIDEEQIVADRLISERETTMISTLAGSVLDFIPGSAPVKGAILTLGGLIGTAIVEGRGKRKVKGMARAVKRRSIGLFVDQFASLLGVGSGDSSDASESAVAKYTAEGKLGAAILSQRIYELQAAGLIAPNGQMTSAAAAALLGIEAPTPAAPAEPAQPAPEEGVA